MAPPKLAGMLEKQKRWRKEWCYRFFILRSNRIDYFLKPPAIVDEEDTSDPPRGSIHLHRGVWFSALEEPGRPYCVRVGEELLSCNSRAEQQRWLEAVETISSSLPP